MTKKQVLVISHIFLVVSAVAVLFTNCSEPTAVDNQESAAVGGCVAPSAAASNPQTIEQAITLINALPKPTSVECFLQALGRPLDMYATFSQSSAQPPFSEASPRIFIFKGDLIISVVPEGAASQMLEFSVVRSATRSLKGELAFPVTSKLPMSAAYDHIKTSNSTRCAGCHTNEGRDATITWGEAYTSSLIKPSVTNEVDLDYLYNQYEICNIAKEPKRCSMLYALFSKGKPNFYNFSE